MAGDDRGPRTVDPEAAQRLRALFATSKPVVYRRPWWLLVLVLLVPALFVASQPLAWHHDIIPGHGYRVVLGYTRSSWVLVIGVVATGVFVRVAQRPLTAYVVLLLLSLGGVTMIGMYSDWANSYTQAGALGLPPYNGPGFFVALAGLAAVLTAAAGAWYQRATT